MKIVYMGTPDFAVPSLQALYDEGYEIPYVVTQPDTVSGRGKKIRYPAVKEKALELGLEVLQPERMRKDEGFLAVLRECAPDLVVVAAYGQILPPEVLAVPRLGCINVHGSLLPRFRGAAPIQRSIIEGDEETGITIMYMEEGLDTGDMLAKRAVKIGRKTGEELHDELAEVGAQLLIETVPKMGTIEGEKQDDSLSTYASMISKKDGHIDFSESPERIERRIRAFDPWPGSYAYIGDKMIKLWRAEALRDPQKAPDGTIVNVCDEGISIAAGGRTLLVTEIQMPGKKRIHVKEYLKGNLIEIGTVLG